MADVSGVPQGPIPVQPTPTVSQPSAPQAPQAPVQQPKVNKEAFVQQKKQIKLPPTNLNALTQLPSKDQMMLMRMSQEQNSFVGKLAQGIGQVRSDNKEMLPKSLIGAGQGVPPAAMRAALAATGRLFAGRAIEVRIGREASEISLKLSGRTFSGNVATPYRKGRRPEEEDEDQLDDIDDTE